VLAVRLQEVFGWIDTPRVIGGAVPVVMHLLGPNYRPVQVTQDLRSFWATTYFQVRKDLKPATQNTPGRGSADRQAASQGPTAEVDPRGLCTYSLRPPSPNVSSPWRLRMHRRLLVLSALAAAAWSVPLSTSAAEQSPTTAPSKVQTACLPETDASSPRHTKLKSEQPNPKEIIFTDIDNDGDPDILETWWNGKRVRWFDENDDMKATDVRGDQSDDALQVDRDGDGYYDGPGDIASSGPTTTATASRTCRSSPPTPPRMRRASPRARRTSWSFIDTDHDGVNGWIPWETFNFDRDNWRVKPQKSVNHALPSPNFSPDYMGNSIFLKQHLPPWIITDIRLNWEKPLRLLRLRRRTA
jgi:hypothetical protein